MITLSGREVWPMNSRYGQGGLPCLGDIGTGLGRMPRFAGQTKHWYPVLAHIYTVELLVVTEAAPYALLHDAPEVCCGDVVTTWKTPEAKAVENDLLERLTVAAGLVWPWPEDISRRVYDADLIALTAEAFELGFHSPDWFIDNLYTGVSTDEWDTVNQRIEYARTVTKMKLKSCKDYLIASHAGDSFTRRFGLALEAINGTEANTIEA